MAWVDPGSKRDKEFIRLGFSNELGRCFRRVYIFWPHPVFKSNSATSLKTSSLEKFSLKSSLLRTSPLKKPSLETSSLLRHLTTVSFHHPRKGHPPPSSPNPSSPTLSINKKKTISPNPPRKCPNSPSSSAPHPPPNPAPFPQT